MYNHTTYIKETIRLAKKGKNWTFPNPLVGTVLVKNDKIIGRGYHHKTGSPHAEIEALKNATENPHGATIYVNLEPCNFQGKTPPCTEALIKAGIKEVIAATSDPNPRQTPHSNLKITTGILSKEARQLNEVFFTFHEKKRPFIAIKFAASLDGKIATRTHHSQWITNQKARDAARKLRSHYPAILVGINTILKDNPHLGLRNKKLKDPLRIILDSTLKIPLESQVLRDNNCLIATTPQANKEKKALLQNKEITIITTDCNKVSIPQLLTELSKKEITGIFVEGGSQIHGSFLDAGLVDKVYAFHAPILIGGEKSAHAIAGNGVEKIKDAVRLADISHKLYNDNMLTTGYPNKS